MNKSTKIKTKYYGNWLDDNEYNMYSENRHQKYTRSYIVIYYKDREEVYIETNCFLESPETYCGWIHMKKDDFIKMMKEVIKEIEKEEV